MIPRSRRYYFRDDANAQAGSRAKSRSYFSDIDDADMPPASPVECRRRARFQRARYRAGADLLIEL